MVRHARIPFWALVLPLPSGPRGIWLGLWSFWNRQIPPGPITAGNRAIAVRSGGVSTGTLARHLDRLEDLGWLVRRGLGSRRQIWLAWGDPGEISEIASPDPGNIAPLHPGNIAPQIPAISPPTPAISPNNPRKIAAQILIDLIEDLRGVCPPAITPGAIEAILTVDPSWAADLRDARWAEALAEAIRELRLAPADVARVLRVWDDTDRGYPDPWARLGAQRAGAYPTRRELWWVSRHGAWLRRALEGARAPTPAAYVPDPCDPCDDAGRYAV